MLERTIMQIALEYKQCKTEAAQLQFIANLSENEKADLMAIGNEVISVISNFSTTIVQILIPVINATSHLLEAIAKEIRKEKKL